MALTTFPIPTSPVSSDMQSFLQTANDAAARTALGVPAGSGTSSGTNTGDQTTITGNAGSATQLQTGRTIALTGDVTATTGSFNGTANVSGAATIANDAVTYAKMQNVSAASKLLGRGDGGSGDVQEITLGTGLSMSGTTLNSSGGGGGTPGGSDTQVQFNDGGSFGGNAAFTFNKTTGVRTVAGAAVSTAVSVATSGAVNIDFTKPLTTQALVGASTWSFTGTPATNQSTTVRVSADGTNRVVTLPANVTPNGATAALASFTVPANSVWEVYLEHLGSSNYLIANQPPETTGTGAWVKQTSPTITTPVIAAIVSGAGTSTLPTATGTLLSTAAAVTVAQGGTGVATLTAYAPVFGGTTGTGAVQSGTVGTAGQVLTSNGAGALPTFQAAGSGTGTKTIKTFLPTDNQPPASNFATYSTRTTGSTVVPTLNFAQTGVPEAYIAFVIPEGASLATGLSVSLWFGALSVTSGNVEWNVAFSRVPDNAAPSSYSTTQTFTNTSVAGTLTMERKVTKTIATADLPTSTAAGDRMIMKITRSASGIAEVAQLTQGEIQTQ